MERGVEHRDHRDAVAEKGAGGPDPAQVRRVVQRREINAVLDPADDAGVDPGVGPEALPAVHDPVADRVHFAGGADHSGVFADAVARTIARTDQPAHHPPDRAGMVADWLRVPAGVPLMWLVRAQRLPADALDDAAREPGLGPGVHELELQGRGTAIEDEHVHGNASRIGAASITHGPAPGVSIRSSHETEITAYTV